MISTNISNFRKNISNFIKQTIQNNEQIHITTKNGNVIVISEEKYNSLIETLYLTNSNEMKKKLIDGKNTPLDNCIAEDEVEW